MHIPSVIDDVINFHLNDELIRAMLLKITKSTMLVDSHTEGSVYNITNENRKSVPKTLKLVHLKQS